MVMGIKTLYKLFKDFTEVLNDFMLTFFYSCLITEKLQVNKILMVEFLYQILSH